MLSFREQLRWHCRKDGHCLDPDKVAAMFKYGVSSDTVGHGTVYEYFGNSAIGGDRFEPTMRWFTLLDDARKWVYYFREEKDAIEFKLRFG